MSDDTVTQLMPAERLDAEVDAPELDPEDMPEGIMFLQTGRVRIWFDDYTTTLRRPRIGQFKRLREDYGETNERLQALKPELDELREQSQDIPDDDPSAHRLIQSKLGEIQDRQRIIVAQWVAKAVQILGDPHLPDSVRSEDGSVDVDELPMWFGHSLMPSRFLNHWRDVPLAPGGSRK